MTGAQRRDSARYKLSRMLLNRAKRSASLILLLIAVSCRPDRESAKTDTAAALPPGPAAGPAVPVNTGWEENEGGPALLLASPDNPEIASVVLPNMTDSILAHASALNADSLMGMSFDLFGRSGIAGSGRLSKRSESTTLECLSWPSVTLALDSQHVWKVGFRRGMVTSLPLDSLEGLSPSDSALITAELARLASALPASNDPAFQGLPFVVRKSYRASFDRVSILVGDIVRKINQEANPREEHLLLIAERASNSSAQYQTVFESRAAGSEDLVRTSDVMAAIRFVNGGRAAVVVSFEYENGSRIALIERTAPFQWKLVWRSAYAGC
jgi:hypothetical protein